MTQMEQACTRDSDLACGLIEALWRH